MRELRIVRKAQRGARIGFVLSRGIVRPAMLRVEPCKFCFIDVKPRYYVSMSDSRSASAADNRITVTGPLPLELRVAAFAELRGEIARRSSAQLTLLTTSLAAFTTLAGLVVSVARPTYELLLLVPVVCACTGMMWLDHHRRIQQIGLYILRQIFEHYPGSFEEAAEEKRQSIVTVALEFVVPTVVTFGAPAVAAMLWAQSKGLDDKHRVAWIADMILTAVYISSFLAVLIISAIRSYRARLRRRQQRNRAA